MNRRKTIKTLLAGTVGAGLAVGTSSCKTDGVEEVVKEQTVQFSTNGQLPEEIIRDEKIRAEGSFFNEHEMATVVVLANLIIPTDETSGNATDAGVPDFIDFMMRDIPKNQTLMRGGLKWMDLLSLKKYETSFKDATPEQQTAMLDLVAYPDDVLPEHEFGVKFFNLFRNMVGTGFFTSELGVNDIGYVGNRANVWDGVPDEVLKKHGLSYDQRTLDVSVKLEDREKIVEWDDEGNIIG